MEPIGPELFAFVGPIMLHINNDNNSKIALQINHPTNDKENDEVEQFYATLDEILKIIKKRDISVIMGDTNGNIGKGKVQIFLGKYGLEVCNNTENRLIQFQQ